MKSKNEQLIEAAEKFCEKYNHGIRDSVIDAIIGFDKYYHDKSVDLIEIRHEFFKKFGQYSFRGYAQEQCHSIFNFFIPHLQPNYAIEFNEWVHKNNYIKDSVNRDKWVFKFGIIDKKFYSNEELYEEFIKSKNK